MKRSFKITASEKTLSKKPVVAATVTKPNIIEAAQQLFDILDEADESTFEEMELNPLYEELDYILRTYKYEV